MREASIPSILYHWFLILTLKVEYPSFRTTYIRDGVQSSFIMSSDIDTYHSFIRKYHAKRIT
jgi:hypothetical protein